MKYWKRYFLEEKAAWMIIRAFIKIQIMESFLKFNGVDKM